MSKKPRGAQLREMWIEENVKRFLKAKTEKGVRKALNLAYDETVYHQIIMTMEGEHPLQQEIMN